MKASLSLEADHATPFGGNPASRRRIALAVALLVSFLAAAWIAAPLWVGLILGTVMAFTAQPLHWVLEKRLRGRRSLASGIATVLGGLVMLGGGVVGFVVVLKESLAVLALLQRRLAGGSLGDLLGERAARLLGAVGVDRASASQRVQAELGQLSSYAAESVGAVLQATTGAVLTLVIALWTTYYVLLEWPRIGTKLERLLPLDPRDTRALVLEFRDVARGAFVATLASAVFQGLMAWVGFTVARVPQALTWSVLLGILSFVPMLGTALVWVPVGIYLIDAGHPGWGAFVLVWGALVIMAMTDYVIRPRLVGGRGQGHPLLTLVSLIGGISVLGLPGLVVGPVIMSLFVAIVRIHERDCAQASDMPSGVRSAEGRLARSGFRKLQGPAL
jgi:predicted PurR-regulated permease PerM